MSIVICPQCKKPNTLVDEQSGGSVVNPQGKIRCIHCGWERLYSGFGSKVREGTPALQSKMGDE